MGQNLDRQRAQRLLTQAGFDALLLCEPEAFHYAIGVSQGVAGLFRRAGSGFALIPADPALPLGAVIGDLYAAEMRQHAPDIEVRLHPLWIETVTVDDNDKAVERAIAKGWSTRQRDFARPATFDLTLALDALDDLLATLGLSHGCLGLDLDFVPVNDFAVMREHLVGARLVNGSAVFDRLRSVKTPPEIHRLRLAAELAEAGLKELMQAARLGDTAADLRSAFRHGVTVEAQRRGISTPPSWDYIAIGPDPWNQHGRVASGAIIKADVGCVIDGYSSDTSRNFVYGEPSPSQRRVHAILEQAFDDGLAAIGPGLPLAGVHRTVTRSLTKAGLAGFSRGHFGHGLGQSLFSEQWPFISADAETSFEPGMVIAFEVPIYATGIGAFNIEDQLLISNAGSTTMNTLRRGLVSIGG
jgi:Xaa-Pro aminopeptidase